MAICGASIAAHFLSFPSSDIVQPELVFGIVIVLGSTRPELTDILDFSCISQDCFLFEIANKSMACSRRNEVGNEHGVEKDALCTDDGELHKPPRLSHLEENQ